jgi:hypothetical protein
VIHSRARVTKGATGGYYVVVMSIWTDDDGNREVGLVGPLDRRSAQGVARGLNEVLSAGARAVRINRGV